MNGSVFLSVEETAAIMRLTAVTVYKHIKEGKIPCKKIGSRILIPRSFLQSGAPGAENAPPAGTIHPSPSPLSDEQIRVTVMLSSIEKHLRKLIASAPQNGTCGLELLMADGCIARVTLKTESLLSAD
jgi:excisionase family DNA binding protein